MKNVTYINAGAGSGKTYTLTQILTDLIKEGVQPEQVILTTFTTKAASEFKEKAKAFLFEKGLYDEASRLDQALIGTVHSVCQRMIGKYWFNLGLSPDMGVMAEEDTAYYISQSLADLPTEEELQVLHRFCKNFDIQILENFIPRGIDYDFWQGQLKNIISFSTNYELQDFKESEQRSLDYLKQFVTNSEPITVTDEEVRLMLQEATDSVANNNRIKKKENYYKDFEQVRRSSRDKSISWMLNLTKVFQAKYGPTCEAVIERVSHLWTSLDVYKEQEKYVHLLFDLAQRWQKNFEQFKREKNLLDYNDMEKYMRQLLEIEDVRKEIGLSFRYLFVDEFQDSSPIQVKIFDSLSDLMKQSFWVGDYKQAIYGFRGSDIALTKAVVDRISEKKDGCDTSTLDTCYRSLPDIVECNNDVFTKTFSKVLSYDSIHLNQHRENEKHVKSLRYLYTPEVDVASYITCLIRKGVEPKNIAVLSRFNSTLAQVASVLKSHSIPSSREDIPVVGTKTALLIAALLHIVESSNDNLAKAQVAMLAERDFNAKKLIESKLLFDNEADSKDEEFLNNTQLVGLLLELKPVLQQQSVAVMIETMAIKLNLFDLIKRIEDDGNFGISCLQTIIHTAKTYEEHSVQMNLPATIDGFLSYIEDVNPSGSGDPEGVQLHTYHSSKGLQWDYVILMDLNNNVASKRKAVKNEMYGVHAIHQDSPTAANPYPSVYIRLIPWLYGRSNVPEEIQQKIEESEEFGYAYQHMMEEANRLLYVGMTRPRDVLVLAADKPTKDKPLFCWIKNVGMENAAATEPTDKWDALGTGRLFLDDTPSESQCEGLDKYQYNQDGESTNLMLAKSKPSYELLPPRYVSPSGIHTKGEATKKKDFEHRISFGKNPQSMATVGDCIHQIYAGIEETRPAYSIDLKEVVDSYGLSDVLTDPVLITEAWNNLVGFLEQEHGKAVKTYHERPFRLERDGQTITGSIDLVWQTSEGDILIDFKTCPMGPGAVLDVESEYYAGWYAGQLNAYEDALTESGERVIARYIYYPVSGLLVSVSSK